LSPSPTLLPAAAPAPPRNPLGRDAARLGSEVPRVYTPPLRPLTRETTLGYDVADFADALGITLFPWQRWLLIHMLELVGDQLRFRTVVVLVARQNGKSTLSQVLALWFMAVWGWPMVLGTAQDLETAEEVWQGAVDIVEGDPDLRGLLRRVVRTNGQKALELTNGTRYKVKAANRRAGRGFAGNLILLDELREHQTWDAWGAITKTTLAQAEALVLALSNAGDSTSAVLRYLRLMGHAAVGDPDGINRDADGPAALLPGADETDDDPDDLAQDEASLGLFEWSAPPGCDPRDRDAWTFANPSLNHPGGITERNLAAAQRTDPETVFRTEVLCQWSESTGDGPFPSGRWAAGADPTSALPDNARITYGVDVSGDRSRTYIAAAGRRDDGAVHVEVVAARPGTHWVAEWFATRATERDPMTVAVQARGAPASPLVEDLAGVVGLDVAEWGGPDLGNGTARLFDLVKDSAAGPPRRGLAHLPQPVLDVAAATAVPRLLSDGGMAWDRRRSPADIAPLVAVTAAVWALLLPEKTPARSAYEDAGLLMLD